MADKGWFDEFYTRRYRAVLAYGIRRLGEDEARDMAADVFLIAWRTQPVLSVEEELPWLYLTARRVTANRLRSRSRRSDLGRRARVALARDCVTVADPMAKVDASIDVRVAMKSLSPRDQEALLLAEWEGLDSHGGALVTGCSPQAFKVRVHRARKRLAQALAAQPVDGASSAATPDKKSTPASAVPSEGAR